jgi:hypothetical protein
MRRALIKVRQNLSDSVWSPLLRSVVRVPISQAEPLLYCLSVPFGLRVVAALGHTPSHLPLHTLQLLDTMHNILSYF